MPSHCDVCVYFCVYSEEDGSGSASTTTPHEHTESDDTEQDNKHLLSPSSGNGEVAFIREVPRS